MSYNLDDNPQEFFDFILGGHTYHMRYPTGSEQEEGSKVLKEQGEQPFLDWMYSFITCDDSDAPSVKDALSSKNVVVARRFNTMIRKEFALFDEG